MQMISQKITSLAVAMATLYISFTHASYAQEANDKREPATAFYNLNAQEQSVLFRFLQGYLFVEAIASLVEANGLCDYCKTQKDFSLSLKFAEGSLDFLEKLRIGSMSFDSVETIQKNCNLCELLKKEEFPFKNLRYTLVNKLTELQNEECDLLIKQMPEFAAVKEFILGFSTESLEELIEQNANFEELYNEFKTTEKFPNILDMIIVLKNVATDVLKFIEKVDSYQHWGQEVSLTFCFIEDLAIYKKFLQDNSDILSEIESLAKSGFKIQDNESKDMREIKTFSEIMPEVERIMQNWQTPNDELSERVSII